MSSSLPTKAPSKAKIKKRERDAERRGVIYMSYVPKDVQPLMIKQLLSVHGEVTRIFLKQKVSSRKRAQYSEGWIEMADRHLAKQLALLLNNQPMFNAGQKKKFYSQELWNLKYLKRVKWHDVTDQFAEKLAVRKKELRMGLVEAKRDAGFFAEQVNRQKKASKRKRVTETADEDAAVDTVQADETAHVGNRREIAHDDYDGDDGDEDHQQTKRIAVDSGTQTSNVSEARQRFRSRARVQGISDNLLSNL